MMNDKKTVKIGEITWFLPLDEEVSHSLLPHNVKKQALKPAFLKLRHISDTFLTINGKRKKMRPPSEPAINKNDPKEWFIYWNHDVPPLLWHKYPRKRIRIKINDDINRKKGKEREEFAEERRLAWKYALDVLKFDPFQEELEQVAELHTEKLIIADQIADEATAEVSTIKLSEEDRRKLFTIQDAFQKFMQSRRERKLEPETISSYQGLVDWVSEGLKAVGYDNMLISELRHIHLSEALNYIAEDREWVATTINKAVEFLMTMFNWLATEEYIIKNPSKAKFIKLPTYKTKHRWYDKDIAKVVKEAVLNDGKEKLYRAMQFTYMLMIRSKKELRKLKIGDIDQALKRVRFSAELAKTKSEQYRDYPEEFQIVIDSMKLSTYPKEFYVFGGGDGSPGSTMCGPNFFSSQFKAIKDDLGLSMDYSIYGWKHTRIVHELMKGTDGYMISYMARHGEPRSKNDYMRDYDITLANVYGPEDLKF